MSYTEFTESGCEDWRAQYLLKNGVTIYGTVTRLTQHKEDKKFHLVTSANLPDFTKYKEANDLKNMKQLSHPFDLENVLTAKRIF